MQILPSRAPQLDRYPHSVEWLADKSYRSVLKVKKKNRKFKTYNISVN